MESIELVEIYLEPVMVILEPVEKRIRDGITKIFVVLAVFGTFEGKGGVYGKRKVMESIELAEIYLEPVMVILEPVENRIRDGISKIFAVLAVFGTFEG
jgi:hypothetical protein